MRGQRARAGSEHGYARERGRAESKVVAHEAAHRMLPWRPRTPTPAAHVRHALRGAVADPPGPARRGHNWATPVTPAVTDTTSVCSQLIGKDTAGLSNLLRATVIYEVTGRESPATNSFKLLGGDRYRYQPTEAASTDSASTELTAKVVDVIRN